MKKILFALLLIPSLAFAQGVPIKSGASSDLVTVNPNTKAARVTSLPTDIGSLGSYSGAFTSGTIAAGAAANALVFSTRWNNASNYLLLRRVSVSILGLTAFTAGNGQCKIFFTRSFTASDSGGTAITLGAFTKRKTAFGNSQITDIRISSTAALTTGTGTDDTYELSNVAFAVDTTAIKVHQPTYTLWGPDFSGEWPLVIANNEGFRVRCTMPATGTWNAQVGIEWSEIVASGSGF
jgi:hypothetical protein